MTVPFLTLALALLAICVSQLKPESWKFLVKSALVLLVFEGAIRKWLLPGLSDLVFFGKDFLLLIGYLIFFFGTSKKHSKMATWGRKTYNLTFVLVLLNFLWGAVQAFNPSLGSILVGLLGLKIYFFYMPLALLLADLFDSELELKSFLIVYLSLAIPVGLLGALQFISPPTSPLNIYVPGADNGLATFRDLQISRVSGTFSYLGSYGYYLITCFALLLSFFGTKLSLRQSSLLLTSSIFVFANGLMTGSRSTVGSLLLISFFFFSFLLLTYRKQFFKVFFNLFLVFLLSGISISLLFSGSLDAFLYRASNTSDVSSRAEALLEEPLKFSQLNGLLDGYGIGATYQASNRLRQVLRLPQGRHIPVYYEPELGRIMLELGFLGFVMWYGLRSVILVNLFLLQLRIKSPFLKNLAFVAFMLHASQLVFGFLVFNYVSGIYYWLTTGFLLLLPKLDTFPGRVSSSGTLHNRFLLSNDGQQQ
ncbi:MAG: hypothetical protein AAFN40_14260 [Cyanobacteria bacterium J06560_6]